METLKAFLFVFLQAVLAAGLPVLAVYLIKYARVKIAQAEARLIESGHNEILYLLTELARIAVKAAEQVLGAGKGEEKLAYATKFASDWLEARGIFLDEAAIVAAIEASVHDEFNRYNPNSTALPGDPQG